MSFMLMPNITLDIWILGPFHNKSGVIASWENVWTNNYVQCIEFWDKATDFCFKTKLHRNFWLHSLIFFAKFDLHNTDFQNLFE